MPDCIWFSVKCICEKTFCFTISNIGFCINRYFCPCRFIILIFWRDRICCLYFYIIDRADDWIRLWSDTLNRQKQCCIFNPLFSERIISLSVDVNSCCLIFFSVYDQHSFQRICHDLHMNFLANRKFIIEVVIIKLSSESNSSVIHDADIMYIIFSARCICFKQDLSCSCFFS